MNKTIESIHRHLAEYEKTADCIDLEIRLSLAEIILRKLKTKKITVKKLAKLTGLKESTLGKINFGDYNWTSKTASKILHALGVRARLKETNAKNE